MYFYIFFATVAEKTNTDGGDGTTTATILAKEILTAGMRNIEAGANGIFLKQGIDMAVKDVVSTLETLAVPVADDLDTCASIATVSSNNPEVGQFIREAMEKVGTTGVITLEESSSNNSYVDIVDGFQFDKGLTSPYFATDVATNEATLDKSPYVLIVNKNLTNIDAKDILGFLTKYIQKYGTNPLVIIADDFSEDILRTLVINKLQGVLNAVAVKAPGYGDNRKDQMIDIAVFTGATVVTEETGLKLGEVGPEVLGTAKKIVITKDNTTIYQGNGKPEEIEKRYKALEELAEKETSEYNKGKLEERVAKLKGSIAILNIAANTETERKDLKLRVEDALNATKAAVAEGIVAGGGTALAFVSTKINKPKYNHMNHDVEIGYNIVKKTLTKPLWYIANNSGCNAELAVATVTNYINQYVENYNNDDKVLPYNYGLNALTGKYGDMIKENIIDPVKVTRVAIQNAASIAGMILTTNVAVAPKPEKKDDHAGADCGSCGSCGY